MKLRNNLLVGTLAALLAFGAVACNDDTVDDDFGDPGVDAPQDDFDDPGLNDDFDDPGVNDDPLGDDLGDDAGTP